MTAGEREQTNQAEKQKGKNCGAQELIVLQ